MSFQLPPLCFSLDSACNTNFLGPDWCIRWSILSTNIGPSQIYQHRCTTESSSFIWDVHNSKKKWCCTSKVLIYKTCLDQAFCCLSFMLPRFDQLFFNKDCNVEKDAPDNMWFLEFPLKFTVLVQWCHFGPYSLYLNCRNVFGNHMWRITANKKVWFLYPLKNIICSMSCVHVVEV